MNIIAEQQVSIVFTSAGSQKNWTRWLKDKGIKALSICGGISFEELNTLLDNATYGNYKFLYLSK